jgi:DNA processing protein
MFALAARPVERKSNETMTTTSDARVAADADTRYWLGLHLMPGIGAARITRLMERFGSTAAAWHAPEAELRGLGIPNDVAERFVRERGRIDLDAELDRLERLGVRALTLAHPDYPRLLRHITSPPPVLYVRGELTPADDLAVGIVGTRRATSYGLDLARRFATELAEGGVTVVSGLARGIDTTAHKASLEAGGRTVAVFGCGLDTIYPPQNRALAERIAEQGALVSEYALGTRPDARNFPVRNRIISSLSRGIVVVEAPMRSGALITATFAGDQGREVYAVPGSALSTASAGCHTLIRDGATLVTEAAQVLDALHVERALEHTQTRMVLPETDAERIVLAIIGAEARHVDELCHESGLPIHETSATLLGLELKGLVHQTGAQYYVRA